MKNKIGTENPNRGRGRPKGALNRHTRAAKEIIEMAVDKLGGAERLTEWAKEDPQNEKAFWSQIFPKLLPVQVTGENGTPLIPPAITFIRGED